MFRDDNDQFMKSFGEESSSSCQSPPPRRSPHIFSPTKKLLKYCENEEFAMVPEKSEEKSFCSGQCQKKEEAMEPIIVKGAPKKINWIKESMMHSRKFSDANMVVSIKRYEEEGVKGDAYVPGIYEDSQCVTSQLLEDPQQCQPQSTKNEEGDEFQENPQTYYMKKVRLLQSKFKKLDIMYQNQIMQLRKDKKELQSTLSIYESFIDQYLPNMKEKINKQLEEQRQRSAFLSSSSQESQNHSMPVLSQIIEVKIQGKKLCDLVKELSGKLKDIEKNSLQVKIENDSLMTAEYTDKNPSPIPSSKSKKSSNDRKFSIPVDYGRHKKQSFQASVISVKKVQKIEQKKDSIIQAEIKENNGEDNLFN